MQKATDSRDEFRRPMPNLRFSPRSTLQTGMVRPVQLPMLTAN